MIEIILRMLQVQQQMAASATLFRLQFRKQRAQIAIGSIIDIEKVNEPPPHSPYIISEELL